MDIPIIVFNQLVIMFMLMLVGALCYILKIVDNNGKIQLTTLLLYVINPFLILNSYMIPFNQDMALNLFITFFLAILSHIVFTFVSVLFLRKRDDNFAIDTLSIGYKNCIFMGIPLVGAVVGSEGILYLSAYITVFNLLTWTHAYMTITGKADKKAFKKALLSPVVVSVVTGLAIFIFNIPIPPFIQRTTTYMAALNTPIAMIIIGIAMVQIQLISIFNSFRIYYIVFVSNIIAPLVAIFIIQFLPLDKTVLLVTIICACCPPAANTTLFATQFKKDESYATRILALGNLVSLVTLPLLLLLSTYLIEK